MAKEPTQNQITVADLAPHVHSFLPNENKVEKLTSWLFSWIDLSLECGKIKPYDFLPSKMDLACHIGVSQGTMQNVYRRLEDAGYIESKQKIGSYIKPKTTKSKVEKLTSKRDFTVELIKRYILESGCKIGDRIDSGRNIAKFLGVSSATVGLAMSKLVSQGIIEKQQKNYYVTNLNFSVSKIVTKTLAEKISESLLEYINKNLKEGDKLPTNTELMKRFNVSVKTIHDAIKILTKQGVLYTRRGQYGTTVLGENSNIGEYFYEKFEQKIRNYIAENCQIGDKLPSIRDLAATYETSEKTIKKALDNLSEDGYLAFSRGRYGGTFVADIPQASGEAYKWLAISSDYVSEN